MPQLPSPSVSLGQSMLLPLPHRAHASALSRASHSRFGLSCPQCARPAISSQAQRATAAISPRIAGATTALRPGPPLATGPHVVSRLSTHTEPLPNDAVGRKCNFPSDSALTKYAQLGGAGGCDSMLILAPPVDQTHCTRDSFSQCYQTISFHVGCSTDT